MNIPAERWYPEIERRRSRRNFSPQPLPDDLASRMESVCLDFRPFDIARAVFVPQGADRVFKGAIGSYGKIKGAPAFVAFVGKFDDPHVWEQVGYTGEGIILEAGALNLATCWIAGFFRPDVVASLVTLNPGERVVCITPVGYPAGQHSIEERAMTGFGFMHRRKSLAVLADGLPDTQWAPWAKQALEAARLAPSAVNRQPWKFMVETDSITVSVNPTVREYGLSKRLCCGIAMLHIEVAALACGAQGNWSFLESPQVARFTIDSASKKKLGGK